MRTSYEPKHKEGNEISRTSAVDTTTAEEEDELKKKVEELKLLLELDTRKPELKKRYPAVAPPVPDYYLNYGGYYKPRYKMLRTLSDLLKCSQLCIRLGCSLCRTTVRSISVPYPLVNNCTC